MDRMTLLSLALVSFPETVLVAALGLVLAGVRLRWWDWPPWAPSRREPLTSSG